MTEATTFIDGSVSIDGGGKSKQLVGSVNVAGAPLIKITDANGNILLSNTPLDLGLCQIGQGKEYLTLYVENRSQYPLYNAIIQGVSAGRLQTGSASNTHQVVAFASEGNNMTNGVVSAWLTTCGIGEGSEMQKGGHIGGYSKYQVALIYAPPESATSGEVFFGIKVSGNYVFVSNDAHTLESSVYVEANGKQTLIGSVDISI